MRIKQQHYRNNEWRDINRSEAFVQDRAQLVLVFGAPEILTQPAFIHHIKTHYINANIIYVSTAGEIINAKIYDNTAVITAIEFEKQTQNVSKQISINIPTAFVQVVF